MTCLSRSGPLKHLGSLRGNGSLSAAGGREGLGPVVYEIDGYLDRTARSANGKVEGDACALAKAFRAGAATLSLSSGASVNVVLSNPQGDSAAEITVTGGFPL